MNDAGFVMDTVTGVCYGHGYSFGYDEKYPAVYTVTVAVLSWAPCVWRGSVMVTVGVLLWSQ